MSIPPPSTSRPMLGKDDLECLASPPAAVHPPTRATRYASDLPTKSLAFEFEGLHARNGPPSVIQT